MDVFTALASGILAGFGVAAPLGAIGILLLRLGLAAGFRGAAPAALAVAVVDAAYCALAVLAGATAGPLIASWGAAPAVAGGVALMVLGVAGIRQARRATPAAPADGAPPPPSSAPRRFTLFLALTAINPLTLLYFTALAAGLHGLLSPPGGSVAFVAGAALGSAAWQLGLVFCGAFLRGRITEAAQRALSLAGHGVVAFLGAAAVVLSAV